MNFKILIAEDEDITRKHLVRALKKEGFEVVGNKIRATELLGISENELSRLLKKR